MAWEAMSPKAPEPAASRLRRQLMGDSGSASQSCRYAGAHVPDGSEPAFGDQFPGQGEGRDAAVVEAHHGLHALRRGPARRRGHGFGFGQGVGQGLFHENMLACGEGGDRDLGVQPARGADVDDVDVVPRR